MKGIEMAKAYYEAYGKPMLENDFPDLLPLIAAGLFGEGSECLGYDDGISRDHDFEAGFCLFLPGEDIVDRRRAFELERAYAKLPKEFMGARRSMMAPVGGARRGVIRTSEFFINKVGSPDGALSLHAWLTLPEQSLLEATNGVVFYDGYGEITAIRQRLARYPEDVRRKKIAGHLLLMAQAGQYNYMRLLRHGETGAAQLAVTEFVRSATRVIFLLNGRYQPYYKWSFRALRELPKLSLSAELFEYLLTTDNESETAEEKYNVIEGVAADVIDELKEQGLSEAICGDLEKHAYSVNDGVRDSEIRNLHILAAI